MSCLYILDINFLSVASFANIFCHSACCLFIFKTCMCAIASVMSDSATTWSVAHQAPLSLGFSRQEYWSGLPCSFRGSSWCRVLTWVSYVSCIGGRFFTTSATWEALRNFKPKDWAEGKAPSEEPEGISGQRSITPTRAGGVTEGNIVSPRREE